MGKEKENDEKEVDDSRLRCELSGSNVKDKRRKEGRSERNGNEDIRRDKEGYV